MKKKSISHSRLTLGPQEADAVAAVIDSGHIAEGGVVKKFEGALAEFLDLDFAISTSSGTAALHLTLLAMGIGPGDEVIIPSYVCTALLNAVNYTGATPILAEIMPNNYNIDAADVKGCLSKRTKAIIVPHLFGLPANLNQLRELDVPIVEDCAQAVGAEYQRRPVGSFGDAAIFSFYATKMITTGEGGMVATGSRKIFERIRDLKTYDKRKKYRVSFNYKMTDIQAALGLVQLERLESIIRRRKSIAATYQAGFEGFDLKLPTVDVGHVYFRYVINVKTDARPWIQALARLGVIGDRPIYIPLHRYLKMPGFPATEDAWRQSVSIPIYPTLTLDEVNRVIEAVTVCYDNLAKK